MNLLASIGSIAIATLITSVACAACTVASPPVLGAIVGAGVMFALFS